MHGCFCFSNRFRYCSMILKPIRKLQYKLIGRHGWVVAVEKLIVSFEEQRIGNIINITRAVPPGCRAKPVIHEVIAAHKFEIVDSWQLQIQTSQLVTNLGVPSFRMDATKVVASVPG